MKKVPDEVWVVSGFKTAVHNVTGDVIVILDFPHKPSVAIALRDDIIEELGKSVLSARKDASQLKN